MRYLSVIIRNRFSHASTFSTFARTDDNILLFLDHLGKLENTLDADKILYPISEILLVTLRDIICGGDSREDIEYYGESELKILRKQGSLMRVFLVFYFLLR